MENPQYAILRTRKLKTPQAITQSHQHNMRLKSWGMGNVDSSRSHQNRVLVNDLNLNLTEPASLRKGISDFYAENKVSQKNNSVPLMEFVLTASPGFFQKADGKLKNQWIKEQISFLRQEFGEQLKFAVLHLDETTPHIHAIVSTEQKTVKNYKNRDPKTGEIRSYPKESWSLNVKRYNPSYLVDLQTRYAEHNKQFGLIRGQKRSSTPHVPLKAFYGMVENAMSLKGSASQFDQVLDSMEIPFGARFSQQKIKHAVRQGIAPIVEKLDGDRRRLAKQSRFKYMNMKRLAMKKEAQADKKIELVKAVTTEMKNYEAELEKREKKCAAREVALGLKDVAATFSKSSGEYFYLNEETRERISNALSDSPVVDDSTSLVSSIGSLDSQIANLSAALSRDKGNKKIAAELAMLLQQKRQQEINLMKKMDRGMK